MAQCDPAKSDLIVIGLIPEAMEIVMLMSHCREATCGGSAFGRLSSICPTPRRDLTTYGCPRRGRETAKFNLSHVGLPCVQGTGSCYEDGTITVMKRDTLGVMQIR